MVKNFFSIIKNSFKKLDKKAIHILKYGLQFCFILCLISISIILFYSFLATNLLMFKFGLALFRTSIIFAMEFVICAFVADKIKKQII